MDPFDLWYALKINTRLRLAMWLDAGLPLHFPPVGNNVTIGENSAKFRAAAILLSNTEVQRLKARILAQLKEEGYKDLKPRQIPDTRWLKRLAGARKIAWVPGVVEKGDPT